MGYPDHKFDVWVSSLAEGVMGPQSMAAHLVGLYQYYISTTGSPAAGVGIPAAEPGGCCEVGGTGGIPQASCMGLKRC